MKQRDKEPVYSISIAARLLKVTPRLLRSYEEAGLICPYRTTGNTRLYSENDMKQLTIICYLHQEKEVNLPGIRVILNIINMSSNKRAGIQSYSKTEKELWEKIRELAPHLFR